MCIAFPASISCAIDDILSEFNASFRMGLGCSFKLTRSRIWFATVVMGFFSKENLRQMLRRIKFLIDGWNIVFK